MNLSSLGQRIFKCLALRLWPRQLLRQLALVVALILLIASLGYVFYTVEEISNKLEQSALNEMTAIAGNTAAAGAALVLSEDYAALEDLLLHTAEYPGIQRLEIVLVDGRSAGRVLRGKDGRVQPDFSKGRVVSAADGATRLMSIAYPIRAGAQLGSVHLDYSMKSLPELRAHIWRTAFIAVPLGAILAIALLAFFFGRTSRVLAQVTAFAGTLDSGDGRTMTVEHSIVEFEQLCEAMNRASLRLAEQQRALKATSAQMEAILQNAADAIITVNDGGLIDSLNPAAEVIFGYAAATLIGRHILDLLPNRTAGVSQGYLEAIGKRHDGTEFPVELSISEFRLMGKRAQIVIVRDVTERKKVERMKTEFVSTVSHELRTPLTAIQGALGLIKGGIGGVLPQPASRLIGIAHQNSERLTRLIDDLLDLQKMEAGMMQFQFTQLPLGQLLEQSIAVNQSFAQRLEVAMVLAPHAPQVTVRVDPDRFQQVMANLLSNAAKYSPKYGTVTVRAIKCAEDWIRIEVVDSGPGIPESFRARIFQKFSQADSSNTRTREGTGLGLSISMVIVEQMQGRIGYESVAGRDTTFFVELPAVTLTLVDQ